jgi:hypothetical protein
MNRRSMQRFAAMLQAIFYIIGSFNARLQVTSTEHSKGSKSSKHTAPRNPRVHHIQYRHTVPNASATHHR